MSITIKSTVQGIRSLLLYPPAGSVPNHLILDRLRDKLDYYLTALNITNENWFLQRSILTVQPNTDEFDFDVTGKPILCVTMDSSDPYHIEREIEIVTVQDRDLYYMGPKQGMSSGTFPHVATSISIFYDQDRGQRIAKVTPQHTQVAQYLIWLQPETLAPPRMADNFPMLENFMNLIKTDTALSLLPAIAGEGNDTKVEAIQGQLMRDMARYDQQFQTWKMTAFAEQAGPRRGWATEDSTYYGW
jgi:hypothetical protein